MILVTGGTGLVGSHLLYHLTLENDSILAIYRNKEKINNAQRIFAYYSKKATALFEKIQWIKADVTDIPSLNQVFSYAITNVYHCAALISFDSKDYKKMRQVNIHGTANIVNLCIDHKVKKLCFVSSIATLGNASLNHQFINEENEWINNSDQHGYAISKYGAEMEVWRGGQEGLNVCIVNPGVILGSGFWFEGSGRLFTNAYHNFKFYTNGINGFVCVTDVVKAMVSLVDSNICNERFILVSENISFKDILSTIAIKLGKNPPFIKVSKIMTEVVWRVNWLLGKISGKSIVLTKNSARASHKRSYYSSEKIQQVLKFQFTPISRSIETICRNYLNDIRK